MVETVSAYFADRDGDMIEMMHTGRTLNLNGRECREYEVSVDGDGYTKRLPNRYVPTAQTGTKEALSAWWDRSLDH